MEKLVPSPTEVVNAAPPSTAFAVVVPAVAVLEVLQVLEIQVLEIQVLEIQVVLTKVVEIKVVETKVPRANVLWMGVTTSIQKPLRDPQEQL